MDALAPRADEGRDKLRKAVGSGKYTLIHRYPNGETRWDKLSAFKSEFIAFERNTGGTETSKYPEEKKETSILQVAASERGRAQLEIRRM